MAVTFDSSVDKNATLTFSIDILLKQVLEGDNNSQQPYSRGTTEYSFLNNDLTFSVDNQRTLSSLKRVPSMPKQSNPLNMSSSCQNMTQL